MSALLDRWCAGGSGRDREGVRLNFLVYFIGDNINLVEDRFEVVLFMAAMMISGELSVEIVFYVFVS